MSGRTPSCVVCGARLLARRRGTRTCGPSCRQQLSRAARAARQPESPTLTAHGLVTVPDPATARGTETLVEAWAEDSRRTLADGHDRGVCLFWTCQRPERPGRALETPKWRINPQVRPYASVTGPMSACDRVPVSVTPVFPQVRPTTEEARIRVRPTGGPR